jgi:hypothetical protein
MNLVTPAEHPFAQFVRILGKGKRGARNLTREEAREAMGMLLDGKAEDTQLGAFLMLLRHKEESAEEMAGFAEAVRREPCEPRWCRRWRWLLRIPGWAVRGWDRRRRRANRRARHLRRRFRRLLQ